MGIVAYGSYLPACKISAEEYKRAWGACAAPIREKRVPDIDEDTFTMSVEAGRRALSSCRADLVDHIAAVAFASTVPPYEEKCIAGGLAFALGVSGAVYAADHTSSTKAGVEALVNVWNCVAQRGAGGLGLVLCADAPLADAKDPLEHGLGAGAAAVLVGSESVIAELEGHAGSAMEVLGERFRVRGSSVSVDMGVREYMVQAFERVAGAAVSSLLSILGRKPSEYDFLVLPPHYGRSAFGLARRLGFAEAQWRDAWIYDRTGDVGAAGPLLGLAAVLDIAEPGQRVMVLAYGSGAGAHAVSLAVTERMRCYSRPPSLRDQLEQGKAIDYLAYLKIRQML